MEPRCVGTFLLEEQIGQGGMGVVYRARCLQTDRLVALKLLPHDVEPTYLKRFEREMEVLQSLRHPHIVQCFGGLCDDRQRFYAMEFVAHGTVADLLLNRGRLPWKDVVDYALQVGSALEYMHERGIVHRDLKPGNLLIGADGQVKLGDFGIAWIMDGQHLTREGKTVGSFAYMSPEQISGAEKLSPSSDLYSLGCVLFEMLAGQRVFGAKIGPPVLLDHLRTTPPDVRRFAPDCPVQLAHLIAQLLEKSPSLRPRDASMVIRLLKQIRAAPEFAGDTETAIIESPHTVESPFDQVLDYWHDLPVRRRKAIAAAALVAFGISVGWGVRVISSGSLPTPTHRPANAVAEDIRPGAREVSPEPSARPSILLFLATVAVLAGLAAYLRKLNREEEENARKAVKVARRQRAQISADRNAAQHYLDDLRESMHFR